MAENVEQKPSIHFITVKDNAPTCVNCKDEKNDSKICLFNPFGKGYNIYFCEDCVIKILVNHLNNI